MRQELERGISFHQVRAEEWVRQELEREAREREEEERRKLVDAALAAEAQAVLDEVYANVVVRVLGGLGEDGCDDETQDAVGYDEDAGPAIVLKRFSKEERRQKRETLKKALLKEMRKQRIILRKKLEAAGELAGAAAPDLARFERVLLGGESGFGIVNGCGGRRRGPSVREALGAEVRRKVVWEVECIVVTKGKVCQDSSGA